MRPIAVHAAHSVVCVCLRVGHTVDSFQVSSAKTAEPIETQFVEHTCTGQRTM